MQFKTHLCAMSWYCLICRYSDDRVALEAASPTAGLHPAAAQAAAAAGLGSRAAVAADPLQQLWFRVRRSMGWRRRGGGKGVFSDALCSAVLAF